MQIYTPFGYKIVNGKFMINKLQEQVIQDIYNEYINGKSLYSIAQKLKHNKIKKIMAILIGHTAQYQRYLKTRST